MWNKLWTFLYKLASPKSFYDYSGKLTPYFVGLAVLAFSYGLIAGLFIAPSDYQQGDSFRIMYMHVPAASMSLLVFSLMAFCAVLRLIWQIKLADIIIQVSAPLGAWFTLLALVTGAIWGKPMWGTWWIWDARLTSELILLFLYWGVIALGHSLQDQREGGKAVAILVLVGFIDIPIIHYSVNWWNTLHQGATLTLLNKPSIHPSMLYPLLAMFVAFFCYYTANMLVRARYLVLKRNSSSRWVKILSGEINA